MKPKEIAIIIISILITGMAVYFVISLLFPARTVEEQGIENKNQIPEINTEIDKKTIEIIEGLSSYGLPTLEGIGKDDIFSTN